eukprot:gnl/TRDRNA2_/TRDRNA2_70205_c0_seq1.p1 gnl/TRDRNA2_/TRDRNA2_70205_c0~~gnl/TRDRNA2_/TRDRNA2_70205_c0_seq1.p1  ORF type:complete len:141 (+),score=10.51 gnl/TRDRNA2_/TRDRNA2_70205_c0_seq1:160-582(+)
MVTFSVYGNYVIEDNAAQIGHVMLLLGWSSSLVLLVIFIFPTTQERYADIGDEGRMHEMKKRLRWCSKVSAVMDVLGKVFTYFVIVLLDDEDERQMPRVVWILEYLTTFVEAVTKWQHASYARAGEITRSNEAILYTRMP